MAKDEQQYEQSNGKRNSGSLGQTLIPPDEIDDVEAFWPVPGGAQAQEQSPEGPIVPFSLDEFAALASLGASGGPNDGDGGQFKGEDLEFESFMFDSGNMEGIKIERPRPESVAEAAVDPANVANVGEADWQGQTHAEMAASAASPDSPYSEEAAIASFSGQEMPLPPQYEAFPEPIAADLERRSEPLSEQRFEAIQIDQATEPTNAMHAALANIEGLVTGDLVPAQYPTSVADWSDQMLSSIDNFSAVLLALRAGQQTSAPEGADALQTFGAPARPHAPTPSTKATAPKPKLARIAKEDVSAPQSGKQRDSAGKAAATSVTSTSAAVKKAIKPIRPKPEKDATPASAIEQIEQQGGHRGTAPTKPALEQTAVVETAMQEQQEQSDADFVVASVEPAPPAPHATYEHVADEAVMLHAESALETAVEETMLAPMSHVESPDEDLPPWLKEGAVAEAADGVAQEVQTFDALAEGSWLGDLATQTGATSDATSETSETSETKQTLAGIEGKLSGDDLEFESFMFDQGAVAEFSPYLSLPNIEGLLPAIEGVEGVEGMDEAVDAAYAAPPVASEQLISVEETAPVAHEVARDGGLPFWLQADSSITPETAEQIASPIAQLEASAEAVGMVEAVEMVETVAVEMVEAVEAHIEVMEAAELVEAIQEVESPASLDSETETELEPNSPIMASADVPDEELENDYDFADLPPIEPFDFTIVPQMKAEERLGFNTEELSGNSSSQRKPLMITADLDVLTDLVGKDRVSGLLDHKITNFNPLGMNTGSITGSITGQTNTVPALSEDALPMDAGPVTEAPKSASDSINLFGSEAAASQATAATSYSNNPITADFDVAPFNVTDLNLVEEESSTEFLNTSVLNRNLGETPEQLITSTLFTKPDVEQTPNWEAPDWISDVGDKYKDLDTSRFKAAATEKDLSASTGWMTTGTITPEDAEAVMQPPPAQPPAQATPQQSDEELAQELGRVGIFKARVSNFKTEGNDRPLTDADGVNEDSPIISAPKQEQDNDLVDLKKGALTRILATEQPHASKIEALQKIVSSKPHDMGARMALAVAYAQSGQTERALSEYQRLLGQPQIPDSMLEMISDLIADMQIETGHLARFHQIKGDLLIKQGHYQDAIEEYNKIK